MSSQSKEDKVSMADLVSLWKENTGQVDGPPVLPQEMSQEFFSYSLQNLDTMLDQIRIKKGNIGESRK